MNKFTNNLILFFLFVPPLIFFTDLTRNPYYFQIVLLNASVVFLWVYWLFSGSKKNEILLRRTPLDIPLWSFFAAATLSLLFVFILNINQPYLKFGVWSEGLKRWLFLLTNAALVYYAAVFFVNDGNRDKFIATALLAGFAASVYGILQYFGIELIWPKVLNPFGGRSVSTFGNPNFLSAYLILLIPVVFVFYYNSINAGKRAMYFVTLAAIFMALLCTMTRSSWLGIGVAMAALLFLLRKYDRSVFQIKSHLVPVLIAGIAYVILCLIVFKTVKNANMMKLILSASAFVLFYVVKNVIHSWNSKEKLVFFSLLILVLLAINWPKSYVEGYKPSVVERLAESTQAQTTIYAPFFQRRLIWSCAWFMVYENPVLGKGWGCFELFYPSYQGRHLFLDAYRNLRTHANNTHNEILEIWSQAGTLGFGLYLWLLVSIFHYGLVIIKNSTGEKRLLAIALLSSIIGMWVDSLLNVALHFAVPGFLYWWNVGLLAGLGATEDIKLNLKLPGRKLLVWALIIFGVLLVVRYSRNFLAEVHYFKGFKASKMNDLQRAIPELEAAHNLQRLEVNNNYELGNCYARVGMKDKAIHMYKESLRANAGYDEIYFNMATVMMQMGDIDSAMAEYTRSLYINPISFESYMALGTIFLQNPEKYAEAGTELFKQNLYLFPGNRDIWNNLGYLYTRLNRHEDAIGAYKRALEVDPDFELAKKNLNIINSKLGRKDDYVQRIDGLYAKVENAIVSKNWNEALTACEKLVKEVPGSSKARLYMANIYFTIGQIDKAVDEYLELLKLDQNNIPGRTNLALAYFELKKFDLAKPEFEKILQSDPNNQIVKQKLSEMEKQTGKKTP